MPTFTKDGEVIPLPEAITRLPNRCPCVSRQILSHLKILDNVSILDAITFRQISDKNREN